MNDPLDKNTPKQRRPDLSAAGIDFKSAYSILFRALMRLKSNQSPEGLEGEEKHHV